MTRCAASLLILGLEKCYFVVRGGGGEGHKPVLSPSCFAFAHCIFLTGISNICKRSFFERPFFIRPFQFFNLFLTLNNYIFLAFCLQWGGVWVAQHVPNKDKMEYTNTCP